MDIEAFLERLEGVRVGSDHSWSARCPAPDHPDRRQSLSISLSAGDGRILVHCHRGCSLDAICAGARCDVRDLFLDPTNSQRARLRAPWGDRPLGRSALPMEDELQRAAERLQLNPEALALIFEHKGWNAGTLAAIGVGLLGDRLSIPVRGPDDELVNLLRYRPDAEPKMLATPGCPRRPLVLAHGQGGPLFIVEGETDAISAATLGLEAIGAPGAATKPAAEWFDVVRGREVVICFDNDDPGRRAAWHWANTAHARGAASVHILELGGPPKYDVGDWIAERRSDRGRARVDLLALAAASALFEPQATPAPPKALNGAQEGLQAAHIAPGELVERPLSTFGMKLVRMLWRERVPAGRVGIIFGPPGQGKSTLLATIAAEVSSTGARVLIASAEDDPEGTLRPRMAAAGAELERVSLVSTKVVDGETNLVLPRDLPALHDRMRDVAMLVIDPFVAHLGDEINSWREQDVRAKVFAPLHSYAAASECAVILVMHLNKSNHSDALSRISGSGGFGGAARFVLLLGSHPDDLGLDEHERRLALVHVKASEGRRRRAMVYRRVERHFTLDDGGVVDVPLLELLDDDAQISPESVLEHSDPDEAGAFVDALAFLKGELVDGPKLAKRLLAASRERGDFSERTLRKAKRAIGIQSDKDAEGWWWTWRSDAKGRR